MSPSWKPDYALGIAQVDAEHARLIDMMDRLEASAGRRDQAEVVSGVIRDLGVYVEEHFRNEEYLMMKAGYPRFEFHRKLHQGFKRKVEDMTLFARFDAAELHRILVEWLAEHIMKADRDYTPWVKAWLKTQG